MLQSIFNLGGDASEDAVIDLPANGGSETRQDGLIRTELLNGAGRVPEKYNGQAAYRRQLVLKRVAVELETFNIPADAAWLTGIAGIRASAAAPVSDPVELIRTVHDLARYYADRFGIGSGGAEQRAKAGGILRKHADKGRGSG